MRLIAILTTMILLACNNSSDKKADIKDTGKKNPRMPATTIMPDTIFTALGTEPFWAVYVIKDSKIVFHPADGGDVEVPFVTASIKNNAATYSSSAGNSSIELTITKKDCSDGMSDETHAYEVIVVVNKEKFSGCGNAKK